MDLKNTSKIQENKASNTLGIPKKEAHKIEPKAPDGTMSDSSRILCAPRLLEQHKTDNVTKN